MAQQESSKGQICDLTHGGQVALDPETNEIAAQDHDPALGAKTAGITGRGATKV